MANPLVDDYGLPCSGLEANAPANASTSKMYYATDTGHLMVYDDAIPGYQRYAPVGKSGSGAFNGSTSRLRMLDGFNANGSGLVATSQAAGNFLVASTPGTSLSLTGNAAQNNTKTDKVVFEYALGNSYVAGQNIAVTVNALYVLAAGTTLTSTVAVAAYVISDAGAQGANLVATAAAALSAAAADKVFTITGATLSPGQRLLLVVTSVATEGGNTGTITNTVNSVRLS